MTISNSKTSKIKIAQKIDKKQANQTKTDQKPQSEKPKSDKSVNSKKFESLKTENLAKNPKTGKNLTEKLVEKPLEKSEKRAEKTSIIIKKPPFLFEQTQRELQNLSELLDCPVLSYFKPPNGVIWGQDLYAILECLKTIGKQKKLALYVRSNGGSGMVSLRIINLLRSFADKLILLAPLECASAATMLALGCDEIFMGPLSSLSPVDSSLTHSLSPVDSLNNKVPISLDELWRVLRLWQESDQKSGQFASSGNQNSKNSNSKIPNSNGKKGEKTSGNSKENSDTKLTNNLEQNSDKMPSKIGKISSQINEKIPQIDNIQTNIETEKTLENPYKYLYQYVHPLVFGAVDRHSSLSLQICKEIMSYHLTDEELIDQINHKLNYDYPAHGYPITAREAKKLGLNVLPIDTKMQDILNRLQLLYSEMTEEKITDYDNVTFHDNSIYSITETANLQITYQQNYDKFYRETEKRYITINDLSGWFKTHFKTKTPQIDQTFDKNLNTKTDKKINPKPNSTQNSETKKSQKSDLGNDNSTETITEQVFF